MQSYKGDTVFSFRGRMHKYEPRDETLTSKGCEKIHNLDSLTRDM